MLSYDDYLIWNIGQLTNAGQNATHTLAVKVRTDQARWYGGIYIDIQIISE